MGCLRIPHSSSFADLVFRSPVITKHGRRAAVGKREPHLYGTTLAEIEEQCLTLARELGLDCQFRQTNHEGQMVDWLQEAFEKNAAVIINPAGFSFGSVPILDALKLIQKPLIEVHITNIHKRDKLYQHSLVSSVATGVICGFGPDGYLLAMRAVASALAGSTT